MYICGICIYKYILFIHTWYIYIYIYIFIPFIYTLPKCIYIMYIYTQYQNVEFSIKVIFKYDILQVFFLKRFSF